MVHPFNLVVIRRTDVYELKKHFAIYGVQISNQLQMILELQDETKILKEQRFTSSDLIHT